MKRYGHLFERIVEYRSLLAASNRARRGKRDRIDVAHFVFHLERNLLALQAELRSGTYRMRPYRSFLIREPKLRRICAAHFRDRVVAARRVCRAGSGFRSWHDRRHVRMSPR